MSTPLTFSISEILSQSWAVLKKHWTFLLGMWAVVFLVSFFSGLIQVVIQESLPALSLIFSVAVQVLGFWMGIGVLRLVFKLIRGQSAEMNELWTGGPYLWQYFIGLLVVGIVTLVGFLLLIIPGIIWSLTYMFTLFILADEKIGFSEAMAQSKIMTQGIKLKLIGFSFAMVGVNILGMLPLFLGLIVTIPLTTLATYVLYVELRKQYLAQVADEVKTPKVVATAE